MQGKRALKLDMHLGVTLIPIQCQNIHCCFQIRLAFMKKESMTASQKNPRRKEKNEVGARSFPAQVVVRLQGRPRSPVRSLRVCVVVRTCLLPG